MVRSPPESRSEILLSTPTPHRFPSLPCLVSGLRSVDPSGRPFACSLRPRLTSTRPSHLYLSSLTASPEPVPAPQTIPPSLLPGPPASPVTDRKGYRPWFFGKNTTEIDTSWSLSGPVGSRRVVRCFLRGPRCPCRLRQKSESLFLTSEVPF